MNLELDQILLVIILLAAMIAPIAKIYFDSDKDVKYLKDLNLNKKES